MTSSLTIIWWSLIGWTHFLNFLNLESQFGLYFLLDQYYTGIWWTKPLSSRHSDEWRHSRVSDGFKFIEENPSGLWSYKTSVSQTNQLPFDIRSIPDHRPSSWELDYHVIIIQQLSWKMFTLIRLPPPASPTMYLTMNSCVWHFLYFDLLL